jgi:hypothetical protein
MPRKKSPVTPSGIDPGTFRLVAQCLNHYATPGPLWKTSGPNLSIKLTVMHLWILGSLSQKVDVLRKLPVQTFRLYTIKKIITSNIVTGKVWIVAVKARAENCVLQCAYRISRRWEYLVVTVSRTGKQTVDLHWRKSVGDRPVQRHVHFGVHAPQMPGGYVSSLSSIPPAK